MKLVMTKDGLYESTPDAFTPARFKLGEEVLCNLLKKDSKLAKLLNITPTGAAETGVRIKHHIRG